MFGWLKQAPEVTLLVVCSANVCRSPVAEWLLRDALRRRGVGRRVGVVSAGTDAAPVPMQPDPRMVSLCSEQGIKSGRGLSRPITLDLIAGASAIYVMEPTHREKICELDLTSADKTIELFDPAGDPIDDPYFGSRADLRVAFERILTCAELRAEQWADYLLRAG